MADIGSGTGKLSVLFLDHGNTVCGVEPNDEMRAAAESLLSQHPNFVSVAATAEATGLPDHGFDFVIAGQAFHWFEPAAARREFVRILRPGGCVVLVWNASSNRRGTARPLGKMSSINSSPPAAAGNSTLTTTRSIRCRAFAAGCYRLPMHHSRTILATSL
jgi:SAM-dependent methyltransferase